MGSTKLLHDFSYCKIILLLGQWPELINQIGNCYVILACHARPHASPVASPSALSITSNFPTRSVSTSSVPIFAFLIDNRPMTRRPIAKAPMLSAPIAAAPIDIAPADMAGKARIGLQLAEISPCSLCDGRQHSLPIVGRR